MKREKKEEGSGLPQTDDTELCSNWSHCKVLKFYDASASSASEWKNGSTVPKKERAGRRSCLPPRFKHALMSAVQDQIEGQRALLEAETLFVTKTRAAVLGFQGTQLRALAMFAEIFERHPYPVVINAAILKLADWFRTRYCLKKYSKNNEPNFQRKERKGLCVSSLSTCSVVIYFHIISDIFFFTSTLGFPL